jgi:hypothetical protein
VAGPQTSHEQKLRPHNTTSEISWLRWNAVEAVETRLKFFQPHFNRSRLKSIVQLKSTASTELQTHFHKTICNIIQKSCLKNPLLTNEAWYKNSRKSNWNTAETILTAFQPHAVEIIRAVETSHFDRTSTAKFWKGIAKIKSLWGVKFDKIAKGWANLKKY